MSDLKGERDALRDEVVNWSVEAAELKHEVERRDLAYEDLKREYDHKCERVDALQAHVRELTSEKDTIVSNAVDILTEGCLEHDEAVKAMTFDVFRKAVAGYTCPLCAKAHVRELTAGIAAYAALNIPSYRGEAEEAKARHILRELGVAALAAEKGD